MSCGGTGIDKYILVLVNEVACSVSGHANLTEEREGEDWWLELQMPPPGSALTTITVWECVRVSSVAVSLISTYLASIPSTKGVRAQRCMAGELQPFALTCEIRASHSSDGDSTCLAECDIFGFAPPSVRLLDNNAIRP